MTLPRIALTALGAQPGQRGKEPPPGQGFDALLAAHTTDQARTAPAEGRTPRRDTNAYDPRDAYVKRDDVDASVRKALADRPKTSDADEPDKPTADPGDKPADPTAPATPETPATPEGGLSPSSGVNTSVETPATPIVPAQPQVPAGDADKGGQSPSSGVNIPALPLDGAATVVEELPVVEPAAAPVAPLPTGDATAAPEIPVAVPDAKPAAPKADPPAAPAAPKADVPSGGGAGAATAGQTGQNGAGQQDTTSAPTAQPQSPAAAERPTDASSDRPVQQSPAAGTAGQAASAVANQVQPQQPVAHVNDAARAYGLRLADTVRELREVAHVARTRGAALARLQLHPAELGGVAVRLKVTAEGLFAQIAADRPDAVQALQQAGAELRRSLEDRGVNIVALEVTLAAGAGAQTHDHAPQRRDDGTAQAIASTRDMDGTETTGGTEQDAPVTTVRTPSGVLVDVLA